MYACVCRGITEARVRACGTQGITRPDGLIAALGLDDPATCGRCAAEPESFVALALEGADWRQMARPPARRVGSGTLARA